MYILALPGIFAAAKVAGAAVVATSAGLATEAIVNEIKK